MEIYKPNYNDIKAKQLLKEYIKITGREYITPYNNSYVEALLVNYIESIGTKDQIVFDTLLKEYRYDYTFSVINSLSYLFGKGKVVENIDPLVFPGIKGIKKIKESLYEIDTEIGTFEVYKASEFFKDTNSNYIFRKKRVHQCYNRTYDFVKKNRDFLAVVTEMPSAFFNGYYHAYAIKDDLLVDPAINCMLINRKYIDRIYHGEIITRLSYKEIEDRFTKMKNDNPELDNGSILYEVAFNYKK